MGLFSPNSRLSRPVAGVLIGEPGEITAIVTRDDFDGRVEKKGFTPNFGGGPVIVEGVRGENDGNGGGGSDGKTIGSTRDLHHGVNLLFT